VCQVRRVCLKSGTESTFPTRPRGRAEIFGPLCRGGLSLQFDQQNIIRDRDRLLNGWAVALLERDFVSYRMAE
jgi:hypothetical protein